MLTAQRSPLTAADIRPGHVYGDPDKPENWCYITGVEGNRVFSGCFKYGDIDTSGFDLDWFVGAANRGGYRDITALVQGAK